MKRVSTILAVLLLMTAGCGGGKKGSENDAFITVDVTKSYPQKGTDSSGFYGRGIYSVRDE